MINRMRLSLISGVVAMILSGTVMADIPGMQSVLQNWQSKNKEWEAAYEFGNPETRKVLLKTRPDESDMAKKLWEQTSSVIENSESLPAVVWMLNHPVALAQAFPQEEMQKKIINLLLDTILRNMIPLKGIGQAVPALSNSVNPQCRYILERIREINPNSIDQGMASMGLALMLGEHRGLRRDDPRMNAVRRKYIKEAIYKAFDEPFRGGKVSDFAGELIYEINNLALRCKAPAFDLISPTGEKVNIPSAKKNTLLVFWGPQDQNSIKFAAQSKEMEAKHQNLQVVLLAAMSKEQEDKLHKMGIDIPSYLDEKGKFFHLYRVNQVPWVCLIDQGGIVKMRGVPDLVFDTMINGTLNPTKLDVKQGNVSGFPSAPAKPVTAPATKDTTKASAPAPAPIPVNADSAQDTVPIPNTESDNNMIAPPPLQPIPMD